MITDSFDGASRQLITPADACGAGGHWCDACVLTFSPAALEKLRRRLPCTVIGQAGNTNGMQPLYLVELDGKKTALAMAPVGAPAAAAFLEEVKHLTGASRFVVFGTCGCLDPALAAGKVIVPDRAVRDEGTSYHYAPAAEEIAVKNAPAVEAFLQSRGVPCVRGKTWTTDAIYRETENGMHRRKAQGCIAVEMECAALQAVCDLRGAEFYTFFIGGDLMEPGAWERRILGGAREHDLQFDCLCLALELAVAL